MSDPKPKPKKRPKANGLLKSTKREIAKHKAANPSATVTEIAKQFGATEAQVRRAIEQSENGLLDRKVYRQPLAKIKKLIEGEGALSAQEIIEKQFHYAAASLHCATHLAPDERIVSLRNLVSTGSMISKQKLAAHMRNPDAEFIAFLYRKLLKQTFSDDEIVMMYYEDLERFKRENASE